MSSEATAVTAEHFQYIAAHSRGDDAFLHSLKQAAAAAGLPEIWIAPEQACFTRIWLRACAARSVIDIGTLAGYSAISMARALPPGGRVHTIEVCDRHADFAEHWIGRSDVAERVTVHRGQAREILPAFADNSADAALIDADKLNYPAYLQECLRIVRRGGVIMADNAFAFGRLLSSATDDPEVEALRRFNDQMAEHPQLDAVIVPLGDGCWFALKQ